MKKDHNDFQILKTVEADSSVSQRKLSSQMELNVASVNFALKRLIKKGFVTKEGENPRRVKYHITAEGLKEKTQLAYKFFDRNIPYYHEVRKDIESRIVKATDGKEISLAIYGASELSEIAYMVVSKMSWNFLGFYLEDSKITKEKILDYNFQNLDQLNGDQKFLLLLADKCSSDVLNDMGKKNIETLDLVGCNI
ncbi:MAG: winged helix-turn-helix transcriptional regulator [Candidatus Scalindua sp.]|jgi:DNA-binding MarR family transcriptional regulator|nr:winged helix-turn-helix transcriptional regulator [Candidatus Scalindua sp.]